MSKTKFVGEFEFSASKKMLFSYISTASGLAQWFADDVNINNTDKTFTFLWDGDENKAAMVAYKVNSYVKFEFIEEGDDDPNYCEFKLDTNELTEATFIKITDYSDAEDVEELGEIWDALVSKLKEITGG
jgi:uncharacterized protein YndB with AHSA1/START domain